jgi:hypothetical protein
MKSYVILQKGFEYNDEIYSDSEGGSPSLVTFDLEGAKNKVKELNISEYKKVSLRDYAYDMEDILNVDEDKFLAFNRKLREKYGEIQTRWREDVNYMLHPMANDEESDEYAKMVNINFYEYVETDIDIQSLRNERINEILD